MATNRGEICKFFASGVNFSIFTYFFVFLSPKLLKFGEIKGVKFLTNFMSFVVTLTQA